MSGDHKKIRKGDGRRNRGNRTGYSTGANAAAAATAAASGLVSGEVPTEIECVLPNTQRVRFAICEGQTDGQQAHAVSIKDGGDDPDATHGAHLNADVRRLPAAQGVLLLKGGSGVGTVTLPGLGLEVGTAAINPVPYQNILDNVRHVAAPILAAGDGLEIVISVPDGEEMAKKTLNARLGIIGGISILGTTGIVRPYSTAAFRASVVQAIQVAASQSHDTVVFTTGGRTEKCAMRTFPDLAEASFVQMGDFVQAAFRAALKHDMRHIIVGAMVGKLTKIAQGLSVTHAWRKEVDRALLAQTAREINAPEALVHAIGEAQTARFAAEELAQIGLAETFHRALSARACASLRARYPGSYRLTIMTCDFDGQVIATVEDPP